MAGDPNAEGSQFVIRFKCADGAKVPAHWHPTDEYVTVLKGAFLVGTGETYDESKLQTMNVGNFILMPKEMRHFAMNKGETIVQVHGDWPLQGELGESVRRAAPGCSGCCSKTEILEHAPRRGEIFQIRKHESHAEN